MVLDEVIHELALPIVLFNHRKVLYWNQSARELANRLEREHASDLAVLLRDHLDASSSHLQLTDRAVSLLTPGNGELFYIHLRRVLLEASESIIVACVRQLAPEREAMKKHYALSDREAQVVDLVLKGYGNRDIAGSLKITEATAKKHVSSIFDKVGVDSRSQLISKLA